MHHARYLDFLGRFLAAEATTGLNRASPVGGSCSDPKATTHTGGFGG